jgi:TorA maturation chaperone TorD
MDANNWNPTQLLELWLRDPVAAQSAVHDVLRGTLLARASQDSRLAPLAQLLTRSAANEQPSTHQRVEPVVTREARVAEHLRVKLREMRAELTALHARNDRLAAALGACAYCWGEEADCESCGGVGRPGWRQPSKQLFEVFVKPVLTITKENNDAELR